ncbi:MAG TPA: biotin transporter BioY [Phycisphaerae bacterium]|nr:biotin transporter BioY [Phycisphaerae bacterium]
MTTQRTLGDFVWSRPDPSLTFVRDLGLVLGGSMLIVLGAKLSVPFVPVPLTFQGFAVVLVGAALGSRLGAFAAMAYLIEGLAGLPVFALPGAGPGYFLGPTGWTAGYLFSFPIAAWVVGALAEQGWDRRYLTTILALAAGQAVILAGGFIWLSWFVGSRGAFLTGVVPFLFGDVLKSALAALALPAAWRLVGRRAGQTDRP